MFSSECRVCRSAKVFEISESLQSGDSVDVVALASGFKPSEIGFHLDHIEKNCVELENESNADTLLATLRRNAARLESRIIRALSDDDLTALVRSSAELTKNLALQHEIANRQSTDHLQSETAQIRALARKMVSALSQSPEMKAAINDALKEHLGEDDFYEE